MNQRFISGGPASAPAMPLWQHWRIIGLAAVAFIVLLSMWLAAFNTQADTVDIVLRWGAPVRVTEPGLNFKIPFAETRHTVELRERAFVKTYESASRDPMELNVTVALNWAVNKEHVIQMYNQFGQDTSAFWMVALTISSARDAYVELRARALALLTVTLPYATLVTVLTAALLGAWTELPEALGLSYALLGAMTATGA